MNKVASRLLLFFLGIPIVMGIVYVKFQFHLPLQIVIGLGSVICANEMYDMIAGKYKQFPRPLILILTGIMTFTTYFFILYPISIDPTIWIFLGSVVIMLIYSLFERNFENSLIKISTGLLTIFYCGFFLTFVQKMTVLENSRFWIALFLILVFMCDSAAWFFGVLFGKSTKGFIPASPNKSLVGFAGGIAGSIASGVVLKLLFSNVISVPYWKIIVLGGCIAITSIIGDLIESVFKRSLGCKDSGFLIPGRGGLLDSVDSILLSCPVYYAGLFFLFGLK